MKKINKGTTHYVPTENGAYVAYTYKGKQYGCTIDEWQENYSSQVDTYDGVLLIANDSEGTSHKFIVAPTQASKALLWYNGYVAGGTEYITDEDTAKLDFDGKTKTKTIVTTLGQESSIDCAPGFCYNYSYGNIPAHSWYLPALGELDLIWQNASAINTVLTGLGQSKLTAVGNYHWSSTEFSSDCSWGENLKYGNVSSYYGKNNSFYVRACTAFNE